MKKKIIMAFGALSIAGIIGFTAFQSEIVNAEPKLSKEEIRKQVTSQYPGTINELELERDDNITFYEVEVMLEDKEYELQIHADTGEVLKLEEKAISPKTVTDTAGNNQDDDRQGENKAESGENNKNAAPTNDTAVNGSDDDQGEKTTKNDAATQTVISNEEAKKIALEEFPGSIVELELDEDDGRHSYEIEIVNGNRKAEIEIDAYTGKIIVLEIETDDGDDD
ncbi:Peptidase propeptide and YPEB domain-containing protein [Mesobacillus persicus]|uniref:Peptidase propeptide and YPEB domain-containing protein n=1 Tax=Mesobacillus persicus TaxID=930146 RepID=A0A1H8B2Y4_9BACI|nr:PepSY domain-containing protein [Mesobacillus persicus]SEM77096.1 Peptidase propeptide and YPEB domain-containing protein [Mesobacillus persicus]